MWGVVQAHICLLLTRPAGICFCLRHDALLFCAGWNVGHEPCGEVYGDAF
ncbi:hypothetical protein AGRO_4980 [Agrobacterium sp. ATCC 31749]|nr:hypothetical protein AGRO_4980 [Agrobacterium sp. ATCC 31749]